MKKIIAIFQKETILRFTSPVEWLFFLILPLFFTFVLAGGTAGAFIFWPSHVPSASVGEERSWTFEIRIEAPGFDPLSHYIELGLQSETDIRRDCSLQRVHKIPDLYLFPEGQGDEEEP